MGANPPAGVEGHRGVLLRGSNGDLWFMRDDSKAPDKLNPAMTTEVNAAIGAASDWINLPSGPVITILAKKYGPLVQPDGVIHHCAK
jgi:hypothetical protein